MLRTEITPRLTRLIFEAVEQPALWQQFLDEFTSTLKTDQSAFVLWTTQFGFNTVSCFTGATEEDRREFVEHWADQDPWMTRAQTDTPEGEFRFSHEITPDDVLEQTPIYQHYLKPRNWHYGGGVIVLRSPVLVCTLSTTRAKTKGPLTAEDRDWVMQLVPHLQTAARLHERLSRLRTEHDAARLHLDRLPHGLAMLGAGGQLLLANRRMQFIFDQADGLSLRDNCLSARSAGPQLGAWLADAQRGAAATTRIAVPRLSGKRPYWATLTPLAAERQVPLGALQPIASITAIDPDSRPVPGDEVLARLFGLTPAECRFSAILAAGATLEEAASQLSISPHTAKTHLKRILSKTDTRRQVELVSLLLTIGEPVD